MSMALAYGTRAIANLQLTLPKDVVIVAIDGEAASGLEQTNSIALTGSSHQLLLMFEKEVKARNNQTEVLTSQPMILEFRGESGQLSLQHPAIKRISALEAFDRNPEWTLLDQSGQTRPIQVERLLNPGFQLNRNYLAELAKYNQARQLTLSDSVRKDNQPANAKAFEMLGYWYQQADPEVRVHFLEWLKSNQP